MIEIKGLSKSFGNKQVLMDIDMHFESGYVYGIVGENGAGKTTLFRCIAGLEQFTGSVKSDLEPLKNHMGFLATDPFFFKHITGREYLQLLCNARNVKGKDFDEKNIFDLPLEQYAKTYSTGMKKKLAITAILLQENEVFILDEPFNGVDIQSNFITTEIIHKLRSLGKTILISSHIFSTLTETCDEIHLLKEGRFVRKAKKDEFAALDREMKEFTIGNSIDKLDLG